MKRPTMLRPRPALLAMAAPVKPGWPAVVVVVGLMGVAVALPVVVPALLVVPAVVVPLG